MNAFRTLAIAAAAPALAETITFDTLPGGAMIPTAYGPADETLISNQYASIGVTFTGTYANAPPARRSPPRSTAGRRGRTTS